MKNFFNKLFGNSYDKNADLNNRTAVATTTQAGEPTVPFDLFVDNKQPEMEIEEKTSKVSELSAFLARNYYSAGFNDGYEFHTSDVFKLNLDAISSDYRFSLDKEIHHIKSEIIDLNIELAHIGDLMPAQKQAMIIRINELKDFVNQYGEQKILSVDFEGWISAVVRNYKRGFEMGIIRYHREKGILDTIGIV